MTEPKRMKFGVFLPSRHAVPAALQAEGHVLLGAAEGHRNGRHPVCLWLPTHVHQRPL